MLCVLVYTCWARRLSKCGLPELPFGLSQLGLTMSFSLITLDSVVFSFLPEHAKQSGLFCDVGLMQGLTTSLHPSEQHSDCEHMQLMQPDMT